MSREQAKRENVNLHLLSGRLKPHAKTANQMRGELGRVESRECDISDSQS